MKKYQNIQKISFGYRFAMLHRLQGSMCRQDILQAGIQPSQLPFLLTLVRETSPVTQDELVKKIAIDKGTTARAISQLEKNGFVIRQTNPHNRRQNLVSATHKAFEIADILFAALGRAAEVFLHGFSTEERDLILGLMDRMITNAQRFQDESRNAGV